MTEVMDTTWVEISFKNYLEEPITPTQVLVHKNTNYGESNQIITNGKTEIVIGHQTGGGVRATSIIENGALKLVFEGPAAARQIDSLGTIQLLSITTAEREYTEFKFE